MFLIGGQTVGPIGTKLGTRIHLDPGSVSVKSRSRSAKTAVGCQQWGERRRRENGGTVGAERQFRIRRMGITASHGSSCSMGMTQP